MFGVFASRPTVAVCFCGYVILLFIKKEMHVSKLSALLPLLTAAAIWHNFIVKFLTVRMVGSSLICGRSYPPRVALTAKSARLRWCWKLSVVIVAKC